MGLPKPTLLLDFIFTKQIKETCANLEFVNLAFEVYDHGRFSRCDGV